MSEALATAPLVSFEWSHGFRLGARGGMTCDVTRCLVRQTPADAEAHRQWHLSLGDTRLR